MPAQKKSKAISELRQDMVSGEWVVIATGRAKRPHDFLKQKRVSFRQKKSTCPFESLSASAVAVYPSDQERASDVGRWWVEVIPNKYPAFGRGVCSLYHRVGPYQWTEGVGFHEIVASRDHDRSIADMSDTEVECIIHAYQDRFLAMKEDACVQYISVIHNHGRLSGATIAHPHSQIIAIPVVPPDVGRSLRGAAEYFHRHRACVHCVMLGYELRVRDRLIYKNKDFVVFVPFASRSAFEIRIFPRSHESRFENMSVSMRHTLANALRVTLAKLARGLRNPDYNFFLHTSPTDGEKEFRHYHWHFEIIPKTAIWAGFEIGTGIEISTIAPETAARFLRKVKTK